MSTSVSGQIVSVGLTRVWLAYYDDWSAMAVFMTEVEALRYAVEHSMRAKEVRFGIDLREAVKS
jgi:hypothetical protein